MRWCKHDWSRSNPPLPTSLFIRTFSISYYDETREGENVSEIQKYETAIFEAERFIKRAKAAIQTYDGFGNIHSAAAKRSSMDLTRALADLRRRN